MLLNRRVNTDFWFREIARFRLFEVVGLARPLSSNIANTIFTRKAAWRGRISLDIPSLPVSATRNC